MVRYSYFIKQESSNFVVPFTSSPNDEYIAEYSRFGISYRPSQTRYIYNAHATGALVIQVLLPLMVNPPSTSSAVVSIPAGSDP